MIASNEYDFAPENSGSNFNQEVNMQTSGESPDDGREQTGANVGPQLPEPETVVPPAAEREEAQRGPESNSQPPDFFSGRVTQAMQDECTRRRQLLATWLELRGQGCTRQEAAKRLGVGHVTLWRLENGVTPVNPKWDNCGRNSSFEYLLDDAVFLRKLDDLYIATIGASGGNVTARRRTAKMATALTAMADEPECPHELALRLRRGKFPVCLQRYLRRVTPELENRIRGPKHFQLNGLVSRRDHTLRFPDGQRAEMPAGYCWVFDDMSANQPFFAMPDLELLFSRQGLYGLDHRSLRWLGKMLVARPREAYRAEDILRFLRRLFQIYGKPDMIIFEQGVWHARKIRGFKIDDTAAIVEDEYVRPEMNEMERANLQSGLSAAGVEVRFAKSAHGKIIEVCFNHLQDVLAIKARSYVNIGRHAGEFEIPAKRLRQVRAGSHDPGSLGFAPMNELSDCIDAAFVHINGKLNSRGEVPDEIWTTGIEQRPLPALTQNDMAVFLPDMRERNIQGGCVSVIVDGQQHDFRAEWMAELGSGYRVYCRFDSTELTLGAAIYNRETTAANHRLDEPGKAYQDGELIGFAQWEMPAPAADVVEARGIVPRPLEEFYPGAIDQGDTLRRRQAKQVATLFSALPRPGQPAIKVAEHRDGRGGLSRVEQNAAGSETRTVTTGQPPAERRTVGKVFGVRPPTDEERRQRAIALRQEAQLTNHLRDLAGKE